jgi:hypothetical protein
MYLERYAGLIFRIYNVISRIMINVELWLNFRLKGIQAVRIDFFFILKVANIRCFILIKCSQQEARFKKYVIMS